MGRREEKSLKAAVKFEPKMKLAGDKKASYKIESPISSLPSLSFLSSSLLTV